MPRPYSNCNDETHIIPLRRHHQRRHKNNKQRRATAAKKASALAYASKINHVCGARIAESCAEHCGLGVDVRMCVCARQSRALSERSKVSDGCELNDPLRFARVCECVYSRVFLQFLRRQQNKCIRSD